MKTQPMKINAVIFERFPGPDNPDVPDFCKEIRLETKIVVTAHLTMDEVAHQGDMTEYAMQHLVDKFRTFFRWDQEIVVERKTQSEADPAYRYRREEKLRQLEKVRKEIQEEAAKMTRPEETPDFPPDKGCNDVIEEDVGGVLSTSGKASGPPICHTTDKEDRE